MLTTRSIVTPRRIARRSRRTLARSGSSTVAGLAMIVSAGLAALALAQAKPSADTQPSTPATEATASTAGTDPTQHPAAPDVTFGNVTCRGFTVVDAKGTPRIQLATDDDGTARITVLDAGRKDRVRIHVSPEDVVAINVIAADGAKRLTMGTAPDGSSGLDVTDPNGTRRLSLFLDEDGDASLSITDPEDRERLRNVVHADGSAMSALQDRSEMPTVVAYLSEKLGGCFDLNTVSAEGFENRYRSFVNLNGDCGTIIKDAAGHDRIGSICDADGFATTHWIDGLERLRLTAGTSKDDFVAPTRDMMEMTEQGAKDPAGGWKDASAPK